MKARHTLLLAGSLWEMVRFFLQVSIVAGLLRESAGAGPWILPWLLFGSTGNLLIAAGGIMLSLFPVRYGGTIGLLRVGKILGIFSFLLLLLSGALRAGASARAFSLGTMAMALTPVLLAMFVLDLTFLAVLLSWRRDNDGSGNPPNRGDAPPPQTETEVRDFH
jgi:hypothetical protein